MPAFFNFALRTWLVATVLLAGNPALAGEPLRLGVFAFRPKPVMEQRYAPLADYLSVQLEREVKLVVLEQAEMEAAVENNQLDLLMTNPSHYLMVRSQSAMAHVLATLVSQEDGQDVASLGGVIVTQAGRADISVLKDLQGKRIGVPGTRFLGGFQAQALELLEAGLPLPSGDKISVLDKHDRVIEAVLAGHVDAGFVRTGIIEHMAAEGGIDPSKLKVIHAQQYAGYPFRISTRLYPEWPFIALPSVDRATLRRLSVALLALDPNHPAAKAARIGGFVPPADYTPVDQLARRLRMPPYDQAQKITLADIWSQYQWTVVTGGVALALVILLLSVLARRNRQLTALTLTLGASEKKQQETAQRLELALEASGAGVWDMNLKTGVTYHNRQMTAMLGYDEGELQPEFDSWAKIVHPDDVADVRQTIQALAATPDQSYVATLRVRAKDGSLRWIESRGRVIEHRDGQVIRMAGTHIDITQRKQADDKLRLAANVFTHAREGIFITDLDAHIIEINDAFSIITGYDRDEVLGKTPRVLNSGKQKRPFYEAMWHDLQTKDHWYGEIWNRHKDGHVYAEMLTISTVRDDQGRAQNYIALFSDISALKAHQAQLENIAHYDALTQLPNRRLLADRLRQAMRQTSRRVQRLAVVYLDLDGFKSINDRYSHETGDQLLIALSRRMSDALREGDTLARIGGDEFVAVLTDLQDDRSSVPVLQRLLQAAAEPVQFNDLELHVSASIGVSMYPQAEDVDADQLVRQADQAMYQAKQSGKNRYHVFDAEQDRNIRGHHESLEHIREALAQQEFVLLYQPKVNMRTGAVLGMEALIRWQHPTRGLLSPATFLPVIENHPLAIELGEWVIDAALHQIEFWRKDGLSMPVSVNVGAMQLQHPDFVPRLQILLNCHPAIQAGDLELEVLETSALQDFEAVSLVIRTCQSMGIAFAVDDFGTGYSSLTYLKHLPAAMLKIDQSFVRGMLGNPDDLAILKGVLGLAEAFNRKVIAEGVETPEHGQMLLRLGCDCGQGYAIARPMPANALPNWLQTWTRPDTWSVS